MENFHLFVRAKFQIDRLTYFYFNEYDVDEKVNFKKKIQNTR